MSRNISFIKAFIEGNIAKPLSNAMLAREAGVSVASLHTAFKRHYGTTPAKYVCEVCLREASGRLLQTDDSIADATGFPNRNHFSRVSKNVIGESPAAFRRLQRHAVAGLLQSIYISIVISI